MQNNSLQTVALIGRPNVGKSTLFNRLVGKRKAIESPVPGTTRDRLLGEVCWNQKCFNLLDLAGIEYGKKEELQKNIQEGIEIALEKADLVIFIVDWSDKVTDADKKIAALLRKSKKTVLLVVNKADNLKRMQDLDEFKRLGDFQIIPISAISGKNTGDLLDLVVKKLPQIGQKPEEKKPVLKLAIVGRPNVGKSTLTNSIIGSKRAVVSEVAGTTRDTVNVEFQYKGKEFELIDTAGIRRRGKANKESLERYSLLRTYQAIRESDVVLLMIDGQEGIVSADATIAGQAVEWGKGTVIAVSKIDLWGDEIERKEAEFLYQLQNKLNFIPWVPVVFVSGKEEVNISPLLNQVLLAEKNRETTIAQEDLNLILQNAKEMNEQIQNLQSIKQKRTKPPIFEVSFKGKRLPHKTQIRYLENKIRDDYPLNGTPLFIDLVPCKKRT